MRSRPVTHSCTRPFRPFPRRAALWSAPDKMSAEHQIEHKARRTSCFNAFSSAFWECEASFSTLFKCYRQVRNQWIHLCSVSDNEPSHPPLSPSQSSSHSFCAPGIWAQCRSRWVLIRAYLDLLLCGLMMLGHDWL